MQRSIIQATKDRLRGYIIYIFIIVGVLMTLSLVANISSSQESINTIQKKEKELEAVTEKNKELKESLQKVQSDSFIERQIRDQLGLARNGEVVVVLPDKEILKRLVPDTPLEEEELPDPVWRKWLKLFF